MADNLHHELLKHCTGRVDVAATRTPDPQGLPRRTCLWLSWAAFSSCFRESPQVITRLWPTHGDQNDSVPLDASMSTSCSASVVERLPSGSRAPSPGR